MNPKVCVTLALTACALNAVAGQLITIAAAGTAVAAGTLLVTPAAATAIGAIIIGGGAILKGLAIAGVAGGLGASAGRNGGRGGFGGFGGFRGRRQAGEPTAQAAAPVVPNDELAFALVASTEPAQCYRRLICNLATGAMKPTELDVIPKFLTRKEIAVESPEFEFSNAAKLGSSLKNVQACEVRYSCPLSSEEIEKLF
jgi:hypothetical protein